MSSRQLAGAVGLALVCALTLTGCTPPVIGVTGLTRQDDGRIVAIIHACESETPVDTVVLFEPEKNERATTWAITPPVDGVATVGLGSTFESDLDPNTVYEVSAWGDTGFFGTKGNAGGPSFLSGTLSDLAPGQVLAGFWPSDDPNRTFDSVDEFVDAASEHCEDH